MDTGSVQGLGRRAKAKLLRGLGALERFHFPPQFNSSVERPRAAAVCSGHAALMDPTRLAGRGGNCCTGGESRAHGSRPSRHLRSLMRTLTAGLE